MTHQSPTESGKTIQEGYFMGHYNFHQSNNFFRNNGPEKQKILAPEVFLKGMIEDLCEQVRLVLVKTDDIPGIFQKLTNIYKTFQKIEEKGEINFRQCMSDFDIFIDDIQPTKEVGNHVYTFRLKEGKIQKGEIVGDTAFEVFSNFFSLFATRYQAEIGGTNLTIDLPVSIKNKIANILTLSGEAQKRAEGLKKYPQLEGKVQITNKKIIVATEAGEMIFGFSHIKKGEIFADAQKPFSKEQFEALIKIFGKNPDPYLEILGMKNTGSYYNFNVYWSSSSHKGDNSAWGLYLNESEVYLDKFDVSSQLSAILSLH